jgi:hypothetical protein
MVVFSESACNSVSECDEREDREVYPGRRVEEVLIEVSRGQDGLRTHFKQGSIYDTVDCQCAAFLMLKSRRDAQLVANSYPMEGTWAAHHAAHVLRISWVVLDGFITFHRPPCLLAMILNLAISPPYAPTCLISRIHPRDGT